MVSRLSSRLWNSSTCRPTRGRRGTSRPGGRPSPPSSWRRRWSSTVRSCRPGSAPVSPSSLCWTGERRPGRCLGGAELAWRPPAVLLPHISSPSTSPTPSPLSCTAPWTGNILLTVLPSWKRSDLRQNLCWFLLLNIFHLVLLK